MRVYNIHIKDLISTLIKIYEDGYDIADIEIVDDKIRIIPIKITKLDSPRNISQDTDLQTLI